MMIVLLSLIMACTHSYVISMDQPKQPPRMSFGLSTRQGNRHSMEDTDTAQYPFNENNKEGFFGIFDGHCGTWASVYAAAELPTIFLNSIERPTKKRFEQSFLYLDQRIKKHAFSGTCALAAYIKQNKLCLAWVGDSRGLVIRGNNIIATTLDHKPDRIEEATRIANLGYKTTYENGALRIARLAVSRALGDKDIKMTCPGAISAEPECITERLEDGDIIVLACDGVWDILSNVQVKDLVVKALESHETLAIKYPMTPTKRNGKPDFIYEKGGTFLTMIARSIRDEAYNQGSMDNISVMVIAYHPYPEDEPKSSPVKETH